MELSGAERVVALISLLVAAGVLIITADLLTGGRLLGWSGGTWDEATEAAGDE